MNGEKGDHGAGEHFDMAPSFTRGMTAMMNNPHAGHISDPGDGLRPHTKIKILEIEKKSQDQSRLAVSTLRF